MSIAPRISKCEQCDESVEVTYDGGYCEDCAIDNLPTGSGATVSRDGGS